MATASEIADRALELSRAFLEGRRAEILEMAGEDRSVLFEASQVVRGRAEAGEHAAHSAEHLAFTLISSAHEQLRQRFQEDRKNS